MGSIGRGAVGRVCRAYLRQTRDLSVVDLRANQDAPWAGLAFGASGIATAQWRVGGDDAQARRWLMAAHATRAKGAFWGPTLDVAQVRGSLYYGPDGVPFLRALIDPGDRRALGAFLERCRRRRGGPAELLQGVAGYLSALVLLHRRAPDARVLEAADDLAHDLLARAGGPRGWARGARLAFAHGRAGTFHALLGWSLRCGRALPESLFRELERLAEDLARDETMGAASPSSVRQRSFCNGAAGLVLLWVQAYEHTPHASYLRRARDAARFTLRDADADGAPGDLCCGLAGRAYALLAMDRIDPRGAWHARAKEMASRAAAAMLEACGPWPNGLFKGYPGLACLARDLTLDASERAGFPLVEG